VPKSDIQSVVRENLEQKQEKAAYAALAKHILDPNQELTKDQYAAGIAAFEKFQAKYTNSSSLAEISKDLADWRVEADRVASGKVKFASSWMTPEEKKLQSLRKELVDLQAQRSQLATNIDATQANLKAVQAKLAALQGTAGTAPGTGGGRQDLAGRLTAHVTTPQQGEAEAGQNPASSPEKTTMLGDISLHQQQLTQEQGALTSLDAKIKEVQSQLPQPKPAAALSAPAKAAPPSKPAPPPPPEPTPPWYMRLWKSIHG
jgi:hypothetical protein